LLDKRLQIIDQWLWIYNCMEGAQWWIYQEMQ